MSNELRLSRSKLAAIIGLSSIFGLGLGLAGVAWMNRPKPVEPPPPVVVAPPPAPAPELKEKSATVKAGDTLAKFVSRVGVSPTDANALIAALQEARDPRKIRPGHTLSVWTEESGKVARAEFRASTIDVLDLSPTESGFEAKQREVNLRTEVASIAVSIDSSLYEAFVDAKEDPSLAVAVSDVLAWEMDFYRDVQKGDRLSVLVERTTHEGQFVSYGQIVGVRYAGQIGVKELFRHERNGQVAYYDQEGHSARRPFLKQPLPFVHITSGFGGRKHPVLGYYKKHQGVDYAAPKGTPVWAVSDGVVEWAGRKGGNGNLISVRHSNGLTSHYAHLSGFAAGVRRGARMSQKQVIGYVGSTGLSTGPHLHFALSQGGTFTNPLQLRMPPGDPIPEHERDAYLAAIAPMKLKLEQHEMLAARTP